MLLTPYEFCFRTTELGKWAELFLALSKGVTLSAMLPMNRIGWAVSPWKSSVAALLHHHSIMKHQSYGIPSENLHLGLTVRPIHADLTIAFAAPIHLLTP